MLHRLLPILLIFGFFAFIALNFQTIKRDVAYKFNISGDSTTSCCSVDQVLSSNGKFDESATTAIFMNQIIHYPKTSLAHAYAQSLAQAQNSDQAVLGTTTSEGAEKWIEVSLDEQKLRAWEGNKVVMDFPISSGKWAPTPKGTFNIWYKTRSQTMSGGSKDLGTYYYLPGVPNNMFFYQGYAIHGAYWHNNFGQPMSHGCVNSPLANVAQLFEWAGPVVPPGENVVRATAENPGTRVLVH
ncbi:L,D-transpeptidase [Candidatus Daviesbacteria bacterium]|nr:L,D-transpeptidase [Candidatus Daviesbacteria bacterium]